MGFSDDLRSQDDQNTRLVGKVQSRTDSNFSPTQLLTFFWLLGDFTKTVALPPIIKEMARRLGISRGKSTVRTTWVRYIEKTIAEAGVDHSGKQSIAAKERGARIC